MHLGRASRVPCYATNQSDTRLRCPTRFDNRDITKWCQSHCGRRDCSTVLSRLARFATRHSYLHWLKGTNFPETVTHAIDFGPGTLSGMGPLTAWNFEGW